MDNKLAEFLEGSRMAADVKPEARVVVHRTKITPAGLLGLKNKGVYGPVGRRDMVCELEVGGRVLARGKIVRKAEGHFFKVTQIIDKEARHG